MIYGTLYRPAAMPISQRAFILAARKKAGLTPTQLGTAAGEDNSYSQAHKWEAEVTKLPFAVAMLLLERCQWLTRDALLAIEAEQAEVDAQARERQEKRARKNPKPVRPPGANEEQTG